MSRYNEIMSALEEAISLEKGELENVRVDKITIKEPTEGSPDEVESIVR